MKNRLPYPNEITLEMLTDLWSCRADLIEQYVKEGLLKRETRMGDKSKKDPLTGKYLIGYGKIEFFALEEVLRFEAEHFSTHDSTASKIETNLTTQKKPSNNLLKTLVAQAAWKLKKDSGKFPSYKDVFDKLRVMVKSEDQASAIIENVSNQNGVTIFGRDEPIAVNTIKNWLTDFRKEGPGPT